MPTASTSFFGWVAFLLQKYGTLFLRGTGMTLLIALTGTILGFLLGLLVAIVRTITSRRACIRSAAVPLNAPRSPCAGPCCAPHSSCSASIFRFSAGHR